MWALLDGRFINKADQAIAIEDRGLTFGDGLFEVMRTINASILCYEEHFERMANSATFLNIPFRYRKAELKAQALELIRRNEVTDGELYWELTRGVDPKREHRFPPPETRPTFFMLAFPLRSIDPLNWERGALVFTYPDLRHGLCEHKTLNLLPNVLAKNFAYAKGGYEALMFRESSKGKYVTEGGSSSYFCLKDRVLLTPEIDNILPGITRRQVIDLAPNLSADLGILVLERRVYLREFMTAQEVLIASTVSKIMPVRGIDDALFPAPGRVARWLMNALDRIPPAGGQ